MDLAQRVSTALHAIETRVFLGTANGCLSVFHSRCASACPRRCLCWWRGRRSSTTSSPTTRRSWQTCSVRGFRTNAWGKQQMAENGGASERNGWFVRTRLTACLFQSGVWKQTRECTTKRESVRSCERGCARYAHIRTCRNLTTPSRPALPFPFLSRAIAHGGHQRRPEPVHDGAAGDGAARAIAEENRLCTLLRRKGMCPFLARSRLRAESAGLRS